MEATLTLHQAGNRLGVQETDLSRLIRIGALPEARKADRPEGRVWTIASEHLPAIASRNGWTIDLRDGADNSELIDTAMAELEEAAANATGPLLVEADGVNDNGPPEPAEAAGDPAQATPLAPQPPTNGPAIEQTAELSALAASQSQAIEPAAADSATIETTATDPNGEVTSGDDSAVSGDSLDLALLDRLLATHEGRVTAEVKEQEARHALSALNDVHNRVTGELDVERQERMAAADRYREERRARAVADAKVAELRDRVEREMALADAEKEARAEALNRVLKAEREAANAVALLGWRARRRYRKNTDSAQ